MSSLLMGERAMTYAGKDAILSKMLLQYNTCAGGMPDWERKK